MTMLTNTPTSAAAAPIARKFAVFLARTRRLVNNWMAAWMAHQERQAARHALYAFGDRELRDIGITRSTIDYVLKNASRSKRARN